MKAPSLRAFAALASVAALVFGCEPASESGSTLNAPAKATAAAPATATQAANNSNSGSQSSSSGSNPATPANPGSPSQPAAPVAGDQISYGALRWSYGGTSGGGYSPSGVSISGLRMGGNSLSFKYGTNLSAWGYAYDDASCYACLFVQKSDGSWVGGKFDWISSSRSSRDLKNVLGGYGGWNLNGVPDSCSVAFVILDSRSKRRSNVIVGTWNR